MGQKKVVEENLLEQTAQSLMDFFHLSKRFLYGISPSLTRVELPAAAKILDNSVFHLFKEKFGDDCAKMGVALINRGCEGEKDESEHFSNCEFFWKGSDDPKVRFDFYIDFIDGTSRFLQKKSGALSVGVISDFLSLKEAKTWYAKKLVYGPKIKSQINENELTLNHPIPYIVNKVTSILGIHPIQLNVFILDRPRNEPYIKEFVQAGCNLLLIKGCDVDAGLYALLNESTIYYGIGGCVEGLVLASAAKNLGGEIYIEEGYPNKDSWVGTKQTNSNALVRGDSVFVVNFLDSGITNNYLLKVGKPSLKGVLYATHEM